MNIAFIGHSYHNRTGSSQFFLRILATIGHVTCYWDDGSQLAPPTDLDGAVLDADLIVVWQLEKYLPTLSKLGHRNVVFVPMYDACYTLGEGFWRRIQNIRILAFCSALYETAQRAGCRDIAYFQFFPDPSLYEVCSFDGLSAFFWQRLQRPNWFDVKALIGHENLNSIFLHVAMDPNGGEPTLPDSDDARRYNVNVSHWLPSQPDLIQILRRANIYIAPRPVEGIGMSFLESMAMGMVVCGCDQPTMNEYIVSGDNGFLYEFDRLRPISFARARDIGYRARSSIELGYRAWSADRDRLAAFLTVGLLPRPESKKATLTFDNPLGVGPQRRGASDDGETPLVTVVTVVRNAAAALRLTIDSVVSQDFPHFEYIVLDGCSDDGTLGVIKDHADHITLWKSEPDKGPYFAMNAAAKLARGRWILFMNAGDLFASNAALSLFAENAPLDADFVIGHQIYVSVEGVSEVHRTRRFEETWEALVDGTLDNRWLGGVPGHQATITKVELLRKYGFDTRFQIAADHEFMYRMRSLGFTKFVVSPSIVSIYSGGGLSWKNRVLCVVEWWRVAQKYSGNRRAVAKFYKYMLRDTLDTLEVAAFVRAIPTAAKVSVEVAAAAAMHRMRLWLKRRLRPGVVIDLRQPRLDASLAAWNGLSEREPWGRWTEGNRVCRFPRRTDPGFPLRTDPGLMLV